MGRARPPLSSAQKRALALIASSQLMAMSLWFSATAVAPRLVTEWALTTSGESLLTLTVQLGFVFGAMTLAVLNVADIVPSRRLFLISSLVGAGFNLALVIVDADTTWLAFTMRFSTGFALAGVYPSGLKVMSGWFKEGRGLALGVLVGALTLGSASPHLISGIGIGWRGVIVTSSVVTVVAGLVMSRIGDGPFEVPVQRFRWGQIVDVVRNRGVRLSTYGYLGHMWELYAMWTWLASFMAASAANASSPYGSVPVLTFVIISSGAIASWGAGALADRHGRTLVAGAAMTISGACAIATPLLFGAPPVVAIPVLMIWGMSVIADSAQFSAMVTETAEDNIRGTALTLQTATGFLLTLATIWLVPVIADAFTWRWAFMILSLGPLFGVMAMRRLRLSRLLPV